MGLVGRWSCAGECRHVSLLKECPGGELPAGYAVKAVLQVVQCGFLHLVKAFGDLRRLGFHQGLEVIDQGFSKRTQTPIHWGRPLCWLES